MGKTKSLESISTKQSEIAKLASRKPKWVLTTLAHLCGPGVGSRVKLPWRPFIALSVPLLMLGATVAYVNIAASRGREGLVPAEAIGWSMDGKPIKLRIAGSLRGEVERFDIEIQVPGEPVYTTDFEIDHDMFDGGFVGGLDVDGDGAIELVLATRRGPGVSRVVEPGPRGIVERDFDELPESAWRVVERRLDLIVPSGGPMLAAMGGVLWFVTAMSVYVIALAWEAVAAA